MQFDTITTINQLRDLYGEPMDIAIKKKQNSFDKYSFQFLQLCPFIILSSSNAHGQFDCSPRGDYPGFMQILDDHTIAIPDRPGNNRLDNISNILENPNVAVLALIPGFNECLRFSGKAQIVINHDLLLRFEHKGKLPKSAIVITIDEIFFHCAKAIIRSKLWEDGSKVQRDVMPSFGKILTTQIKPDSSDEDVKSIEDLITQRARTTLY